MEAKAIAKYIRMSPRKVRLVADMIRGKSVTEALVTMRFNEKKASGVLEKVVKSAIANARQVSGADEDSLIVKEIFVDEGPTLRRFIPRAMGRATRIRKRTSHITVVLENYGEDQVVTADKQEQKA